MKKIILFSLVFSLFLSAYAMAAAIDEEIWFDNEDEFDGVNGNITSRSYVLKMRSKGNDIGKIGFSDPSLHIAIHEGCGGNGVDDCDHDFTYDNLFCEPYIANFTPAMFYEVGSLFEEERWKYFDPIEVHFGYRENDDSTLEGIPVYTTELQNAHIEGGARDVDKIKTLNLHRSNTFEFTNYEVIFTKVCSNSLTCFLEYDDYHLSPGTHYYRIVANDYCDFETVVAEFSVDIEAAEYYCDDDYDGYFYTDSTNIMCVGDSRLVSDFDESYNGDDCNDKPTESGEKIYPGASQDVCDCESTNFNEFFCQSQCVPGEIQCGSTCFNPYTNINHCGGCDIVCSQNEHSTPKCENAKCIDVCDENYGDCSDSVNGCETYLPTSNAHCGECGNDCMLNKLRTVAVAGCNQGDCQILECSSNLADCNSDYNDGCEENLLSSVNHCGECGNKCEAGEECIASSCVNPTTEDVDGDGILDSEDLCPNDPNNDVDGDGFCADKDNCPDIKNDDQSDIDEDGVGDLCDDSTPSPPDTDAQQTETDDILQDDDTQTDEPQTEQTNPDDPTITLGVISPRQNAVYETKKIKIELQTNADIRRCQYVYNYNSYILERNPINVEFEEGKHSLHFICGDKHMDVSFTVKLPKQDVQKLEVELVELIDITENDIDSILGEAYHLSGVIEEAIDEYSLEKTDTAKKQDEVKQQKQKHEQTKEVVDIQQSFVVEDNATTMKTVIETSNTLKDMDVYIEFPKCAAELLNEIEFSNENYKIIKDDPIVMWHFAEVNDEIDLSYSVNKKLDAECIAQLKALPIADEIGDKINYWSKSVFYPVLILPIIGGLIIYLSKHSSGIGKKSPEDQKLMEVNSLVSMKRQQGKDDATIMQELREAQIDETLIGKIFNK
jgi:hypothetical protein